jgi:hypothetical protein
LEGNDIGVSYVARYAVRFEDLLMYEQLPEARRGFKGIVDKMSTSSKDWKATKYWKPYDMPMKSLLHLLTVLRVNVVVITYLDDDLVPVIESWLARKGAAVEVISYDDPYEWAEDLRRDPEIKRYFTSDLDERDILGWQHCTVVRTSQAWGL